MNFIISVLRKYDRPGIVKQIVDIEVIDPADLLLYCRFGSFCCELGKILELVGQIVAQIRHWYWPVVVYDPLLVLSVCQKHPTQGVLDFLVNFKSPAWKRHAQRLFCTQIPLFIKPS